MSAHCVDIQCCIMLRAFPAFFRLFPLAPAVPCNIDAVKASIQTASESFEEQGRLCSSAAPDLAPRCCMKVWIACTRYWRAQAVLVRFS